MAADEDWDSLIRESDELMQKSRGFDSFPRVQRSAEQLEHLAKQLTSRPGASPEAERTAAEKFLASGGVDESRLRRDAASLQLRPSLEDVFPAEAPLAEALDNLHESIITSSLSQAHKELEESFEERMIAALERDWEGHAAAASQPARLAAGPAGTEAKSREAYRWDLPSGLKPFLDVVKALNSRHERGEREMNAAAEFEGAMKSCRHAFVWRILSALAFCSFFVPV